MGNSRLMMPGWVPLLVSGGPTNLNPSFSGQTVVFNSASNKMKPWLTSNRRPCFFFFALTVMAASALMAFTIPVSATPEKPNFVIIMADDLGYGDIGCFGSKTIPTPHIDALAAEGMKFTDYHSNGAVCSPTRAALMTGRYQQRAGIGGVVSAARHRHTGLAVEETTFADVLSKNGYATAIFGKWHLGYDPKFNPVHQGFSRFRGYVSGNVDFFTHIDQAGYEDWWDQDNLSPENGYTTHLITRHAIQFIEEVGDRPFCLYLPHEAPHYPYQGPNDSPIREKGSVKKLKGERTDIANAYREMVVEMDKGVGEVIAALKTRGLRDSTLVIFCSDNGPTQNGSNGGLRGYKGQIWEGGHRVPAIASWPGKITQGSSTDITALSMDWFPTLLDAAGVSVPEGLALDGVSLLPSLTQEGQMADRTLFWDVGGGTAVRQGDWKYVIEKVRGKKKGSKKTVKGAVGLYNLSRDLKESTPVDNPTVTGRLKAALDAWLASWKNVEQRS